MLKKCTFRFLLTLLAMAGMSAAATMTPVTPRKDGNCYQIGTAAELYGFAAIVNGTDGHTAEPTACGVLTADIVVNENVLSSHVDASTGSWTGYAPSYDWTPIGTSTNMFRGAFDGQGHTISGLYFWETSSYYVGLFGYVGGGDVNVSIKNVGVVDSYFRVKGYSGGIVGMVYNGSGVLNIENVYSGSVLYIKDEGEVGGLVGYVKDWTLNITNAYNSGSIFGTSGTTKASYVAGLVGCISKSASVNIKNAFNNGNLNGYAPLVNSNATVTNSFYLGNQSQGGYGVNKSSEDFSNGSVFAALRSAEGGSVWHQYQGDSYPSFAEKEGKTPFVPHSATLHYSSTESETIYFVEGSTASLPTMDKSGNPVLGWYDNEGLTGTKYTEIPASANSDLTLYPKVMKLVGGCYEISDADMLYAFAAAVNNGNATACGKLIENIVVNQNVLTTADGTSNVSSSGEYVGSNSASFRQWTPIGVYNTKPFTGTFDGQGHTISGLYDGRETVYTGLFGYVSGTNATISIKNVGVEDSYFRVDSYAGGIVGMVYNGSGTLNIENVYSASTFNVIGSGSVLVGGLVGYVGPDWTLNITNAYNLGSIFAEQSIFYCAGLVGYIYSSGNRSAKAVNIKNAFNYGTLSGGCFALLNAPGESVDVSVENSYYLGNQTQGAYGEFKSKDDFDNGMVFAALYSDEDGEVWRQYENDVYPTFVEKNGTDAPSPMHVAVLHYSATDSVAIAYTEGTALTLPTTLPDGSIVVGDWYKLNSLSGDTYTQIAATEDGDLAFYAKAMKLGSDGYYEIATADDLYKFAEIVNDGTVQDAKAKLTADICVNACGEGESVLGTDNANVDADGNYIGADSASFRKWTPIGTDENWFNGTFDGQGYTISGLYINAPNAANVGLFGHVYGEDETVSISNIGIEDSYFKAESGVGGVVGYAEGGALVMKNVFNAAVVVGASYVGGIVGYVYLDENQALSMSNVYNVGSINCTDASAGQAGGLVGDFVNDNETSMYIIKNSYNYGTVTGGNPLVGQVDSENENVSVTNSYYVGSSSSGDYGTVKSSTEFADGTVYAALHSAEGGEDWRQYAGDDYPTLSEKKGEDPIATHSVTLHYSATELETIYFAEGAATPLPTADENGNIIVGWYDNSDFTGTKYSEIPATATSDLQLYPKAMEFDGDGFYKIATADDLYAFASAVNNNSTFATAKAKLMNDIVVNQNVLGTDNANVNADGSYNNAQAASAFRVWTPIGNSTNKFQGAFNGQGHTISGLYFNNPDADNVGLFGYTGAVSIDNVGVVDSYFRGGQNVGSIVGQAEPTVTVSGKLSKALTVTKSYNKGVVTGTGNVGGLVGKNGNVKFSYNMGSVTGNSNVGGLVGSNIYQSQNKFEINGSYNVGLVKMGTGSGNAVLGEGCSTTGNTGAVKNVYYLGSSGDECSGAFSMTSYEFADGFVAITLHNDNTITGADIWGQVVGADKTPTLTGEIRFLLKDGCFEIANEEDLYLFAGAVNNGVNSEVCAKLTQDIVVNENVLANVNADGSLKDGVNFKEWTPIGNWDNPFQGTFHGQGHTISGLYFNDTGAEDVGLFGDVNGTVTIDSVGLVDSYIMAGSYVGGLVGFARGSLTISNSYNASSVTSDTTFGGLVGAAGSGSSLAISNSYNVGSLNGGGYGGGLVGYANALGVSNSYNAGPIYNSDELKALVGGITSSVDDASTVTNSFNYGTISYPSNIEVVVDDLVAEGGEGKVTVTNSFTIGESVYEGKGATQKSTTEFADGTVYAALHSAEGGEDWLQYAGDAYPTLAAKTGTGAPSPMHVAVLHYSETDSVVIAYTEGETLTLPAEDNSGNPIAGWTTSADGTGDVITEIPTSATTDLKLYPKAKTFEPNAEGYYEIATADDLYKFAEIVNNRTAVGSGTELGVKAKLIADICVNACGEGESVLGTDNANVNVDGNYIGSATGLREWTPIGNKSNSFTGVFDGQGHSISGLYFNKADAQYVGLFGTLSTATIKNVGVEDSYFKGSDCIGGILGIVDIDASVNIENVYNAAVVVGGNRAGGIIGGDFGNKSHVTNAYNVGMVLSGHDAGGIVGYNYSAEPTTIQNSFNYGTVSAGSGTAGALIGEVADYYDAAGFSVTNSFYLGDAANGDYGTYKSATEFADGTVLIALRSGEDGNVWVQNPNDKYPTIDINAKNANTIVLDWSSAADSTTLAAAGYTDGAVVVVKGGKQFYADGEIYEGILSAEQVATIGDNKLYPIGGVKLETVGSTLVATLNGDANEPVVIPTDVEVGKVVYNRSIQAGTNTTIMLPFEVSLENISSGFTFYKFKRVAENDKGRRYVVKVTTVKDKLEANTPYIVVAKQNASTIEFNASVTLNTTTGPYETRYDTAGGVWKMRGTYEYKVWEEGDSELGRVYGFAAQNTSDVKIGEFVKLGAGASCQPMRINLIYEKTTPNALARPSAPGMNSFARVNEMPELVGIEVEDGEEETTIVRNIKVVPTVVKSNRWFDMKGRALGGKPTAKGTYYYNGQRVIVK